MSLWSLQKQKKASMTLKMVKGKTLHDVKKDVEKEKSCCKLQIKTKKLYILKSYGNLMQNMTMSIIENISASMDT